MKLFREFLCDAAEPWQLGFQDPATPVMEGLIELHHDLMFFLAFILVFVMWVLGRTLYHFNASKKPYSTQNHTRYSDRDPMDSNTKSYSNSYCTSIFRSSIFNGRNC